ncbi:hypothetical protein [Ornithinibacillus bavariensis]|uniref:WYL domain-containing protein n=1 Tax=Ornithinibacillus bavariensis TaxID=545502 RepID=A0A920C9L9_9BACI|nr:hypothetical protein [Ornithinibacillus bavariensis]GIO28647.1 hypothetical protein J43TS3_32580 [Ornithinibacillus bavariensis]
MIGLFQRSIENREKIIIFYIDNKNQVTQRYIQVISMNTQSLIAFCFWRKKVRTFKLENILSAGPIRKKVGA